MQIQFVVNQQEAVRRGFNADSTVKLEVDVPTLTPDQRVELARCLDKGEWRGMEGLNEPTLNGVLEVLTNRAERTHLEERRSIECKEKEKAAQESKLAEVNAAVLAGRDLQITKCGNDPAHSEYVYRSLPGNIKETEDLLCPEAKRLVRGACEAYELKEAEGKRIKDAARAAEEAAKQAAKDRLAAQIKAKVMETGGILAERYAAKYATDDEVIGLIRDAERARLGVSFTGHALDWGREDGDSYAGPLTDEQFVTLKEWKAKLPADASFKMYDLHDDGRDDPEGSDSEHDHHVKLNRILVVEAQWKCGEVTVKTDAQIGTLPDIEPEE